MFFKMDANVLPTDESDSKGPTPNSISKDARLVKSVSLFKADFGDNGQTWMS